jgi:ribosomal protein S12 methylthiotransferase
MPYTSSHKKTINIVTLGCSKNTVDSEKLMKQAEAAGYTVVYDRGSDESDIVIVNTCGFINDAKAESIDTIVGFAEAKKSGEIDALHVMGCLSERYRDELEKEIPEVDSFFGVNDISQIIKSLGSDFKKELYSERVLTGPGYFAYLKISEGCDRTCAFCAIPAIRGKYISRTIEELTEETRKLASSGVKEIILIAQDLSYYGIDIYGKQSIVKLVKSLSDIEEIRWIRLHYLYPANFPFEIIELLKENPKVCRYIDLPIQHISDNVLKMMRRSHSGEDTRRVLDRIRHELPDAAIRTTLIVGHPGETEKDFSELIDFVKEFRFNRLGVFTYSHEEDTYGYINYSDTIPEKTKSKRADLLMQVQQQISAELNSEQVGKSHKVIIDRKEGLFYIGRTQYDSPEVDQEVLIPANNKTLIPGEIVTVKVTTSSEFDLIGEIN